MTQMTRLFGWFVACSVLLVALLVSERQSFAQGLGGMGMPGGGQPSQSKPAPNPKEPVTHAASGASDDTMRLGGSEPTLPANPLEISPEVQKQIGTDADRDIEKGRVPKTYRTIIPPYYSEKSGQYSFKTVFPVWVERKQPNDRASLYGMLYYNRRSTKYDADVLFPLIWNLRDDKSHTTVVGPFVHHHAPGEQDNWLAPLFFSGSGQNSGYLHILPPLVFTRHSATGGFNWIGLLYYCAFQGYTSCSPSHTENVDYGVAPFFFAGKSERSRYEFVPPLLHYFNYSELDDSSTNVWGPLIWKHSADTDTFDVFPIFWHNWGKNEDHVTVFPLFHYGYEGNSSTLINPLFYWSRGEKGESTFATWAYARYRGRTTLDMVTPLYWHYTDPDIGLSRTMVLPFVYTSSSPRGYDTGVFPFFFHGKRYDLSETTWVTPFFQHTHDLEGWATNVYPFLFLGRTNESTHTVVAPIFWDFASPHSRSTVAFPLYWRFSDDTSVSQLLGNMYYHERRVGSALDWEFHFFPAFSYGETPDGHWWNILFGLAGYTRRGPLTKVRALWIPITTSDAPTPSPD